MKDYTIQIPLFLQTLTRPFVWSLPDTNAVYLTFDDGPTPEVTHWVLEVLNDFGVKGTFFCIGRNVDRHPEIFQDILEAQMGIGHHTYSHLNGWKTDNKVYVNDAIMGADLIPSRIFRPPYGRIRMMQAYKLSKMYKVIMWDVLSKDYSNRIPPQQVFDNVKQYTKPGSIIVFHDSVKAFRNLQYALPKSIEFLLNKGFDLSQILK